ncbi:hypothetical protein JIN85_06495 [Luteolibacter pohnpeiensis]|uniref:Integral membrane protein n=1 Tax=Luteolibacter pohnpeiensis TaxID=454153 RepID=A0A934S3Y7_9BACT|nr:hypothetical protein [Luteolibacter pohnpeiensis]MBK1882056.1 hypothetical protein [Luteolibacter pohnpeiensis]
MQRNPCFFVLAGLMLSYGIASSSNEKLAFHLQKERPKLQSWTVGEASGLAFSPTDPQFMWVVNDSGAMADLHLLNLDGTDRGVVRVKGAKNVDWEDLASFTLKGKSYLLIADSGDNQSSHKSRMLYIVEEPALPKTGQSLASKIHIAWKIEYQYEGGPRDCEAVAVDAQEQKILLISKRTKTPIVYELPLKPSDSKATQVAKKIGKTHVDAPKASLVHFASQPTGLDISADGSMAAVVTYFGVFLFRHQTKESWSDTFDRKPIKLSPHLLPQAESIAFTKDMKSLYVISEGFGTPIVRYQKDQ